MTSWHLSVELSFVCYMYCSVLMLHLFAIVHHLSDTRPDRLAPSPGSLGSLVSAPLAQQDIGPGALGLCLDRFSSDEVTAASFLTSRLLLVSLLG